MYTYVYIYIYIIFIYLYIYLYIYIFKYLFVVIIIVFSLRKHGTPAPTRLDLQALQISSRLQAGIAGAINTTSGDAALGLLMAITGWESLSP